MTRMVQCTSYTMIAEARDQRVLYYAEFGSYQGEWIMLAKSDNYYIYKDWYGSCSGCDALQAEFGYKDNEVPLEEALKFAANYEPFLVVDVDTMINVVSAGNLSEIVPANIRGDYGDLNLDEAVSDMMLAVKLEENLGVTAQDIINARNAELQQRVLSSMGYEEFCRQARPEVIHKDGENALLKVGEITLVHVKDSSTPRRYMLRVPPNMGSVRQAIAWTFGLLENDYKPIVET